MAVSSWLATMLDQEMIEAASGVAIAARGTRDEDLPWKSGAALAVELRGRLLIRYLLPGQLEQFFQGSQAKHFVTPTPYAAGETVKWLGLPRAAEPRTHLMLLDPVKIAEARGPRWIRFGLGIE